MGDCIMVDLVQIGLVLVLAGFGILVASMLTQKKKGEAAQVQGGGVVLIGPIPIIFGSDARWATIVIVLAIVLVVLTIILNVV